MTKFEINQYLTKIYNVAVSNVNTENVLGNTIISLTTITSHTFNTITIIAGKWKRLYGKKRVVSYKRRTFKRAIVEFDSVSSSNSSNTTIKS